MLIQIEKKGKNLVVTNNPPIKYRKFSITVKESDIVSMESEHGSKIEQNAVNEEVIELRKKYPGLQAIDRITSTWYVNEADDNLLSEYFKQRDEDEGAV